VNDIEFKLKTVERLASIEVTQKIICGKLDKLPLYESLKSTVSTNRRLIFLVLGLLIAIGVKGIII